MQNDIRPPRRPTMPSRYGSPLVPPRPPADTQPDAPISTPIAPSNPPVAMPPVQPMTSAQSSDVTPPSTAVETTVSSQADTPEVPQSHEAVIPEHAATTETLTAPTNAKKSPRGPRRRIVLAVGAIIALLVVAVIGAIGWYYSQLSAVTSKDDAQTVQLMVPEATSPAQIGEMLKEEGLIRSELAFSIYVRLNGVQQDLKAGSYILSTSESMTEIVTHLTSGRVDEFSVTFYPGAALSSGSPTDSTPSHREVLLELGYEAAEIDAAFVASYDHPLMAGRPASADLEGYVHGDTYRIAAGSTVKDILVKTFDTYYERLERAGIVDAVAQSDMNLYETITLASIVQREVANPGDQPQVAQVFLSRLDKGMNLGSDVTYQYVADKTGVPRDVNLDSPYNTRRYGGLPPGPIASPGISAVDAVVNPAEGDYLYFLSGDDDVTYYARTVEEHEKNIRDHCEEKCQIL